MAGKKILGIYFGPRMIGITECQARQIIAKAEIPIPEKDIQDLATEKIPEEIRMVALLKEAFRMNEIETRDAVVGLSSKDVLVRYFTIPSLPKQELESTIKFESRKYLPFKIEELVYDFQIQSLKAEKKIKIIFVAIKKDILGNYNKIIDECGLRVQAIELASFSLLRNLKLYRHKIEKGTQAVIELSKEGGDIVILDNGFPQFSRDIAAIAPVKVSLEKSSQPDLSRLINEIRISFDYYRRQTIKKDIEKTTLIADSGLEKIIDELKNILDIPIGVINAASLLDLKENTGISLAKAYAGSLRDTVSLSFKINLYKKKAAARMVKITKEELSLEKFFSSKAIMQGAALGIALIILTAIFGIQKTNRINKYLEDINKKKPIIVGGLIDKSLSALEKQESENENKISLIEEEIKSRKFLTPILDAIPRIMPRGAWLTELTFQESGVSPGASVSAGGLTLKGSVYLNDEKEELDSVNNFVQSLKQAEEITDNFEDIELLLVNRDIQNGVTITNFEISCKQ